MLIKKAPDIRSSEITPKSVYLRRREFIQGSAAALVAAGFGSLADDALAQGGLPKLPNVKKSPLSTTEPPSAYEHVTSYNNFYEFAPGAGDGPKKNSTKFKATPWTIEVDGLCNKPAKYNLEDFIKPYALEERIYRFRCVEAWSFVIPWVGIPLSEFIKRAEPQGKAQYVEFTTLHDVARFPMQRTDVLEWPYREGLRLDEANHPLSIMAVGHLRRGAAGAERRPDPAHGAVEVRLQEHQVDRQDAVRREAAAQHLAGDGAKRVRVLRQREPDRGSSALEPGAREAAARASSPTAVPRCSTAMPTRFRASTPEWTSGATSEPAAPARPDAAPRVRMLKPITLVRVAVFLAALVPAARLVWGFYTNDLTANPGDYITDQTGTWTLGMLFASLSITPLRRLHRLERSRSSCGGCSGCSRSSTRCCTCSRGSSSSTTST